MPTNKESSITVEEEEEEEDGEEEEDCSGVAEGWYIPRPALCRNHTTCSSSTVSSQIRQLPPSSASMHAVAEWLSPTPSSNTSTQSGSSGSLLLTAANLAALRLEPPGGGKDNCGATKEDCAGSVASSTHFTMVNYGIHRAKEPKQSCCAKHHVTTLVVTTCSLFLVGLIMAVYYIDMRSRSVQYS